MKKTLARAQKLRDQLMKVYTDIHHTIDAGNANLASLDSAESREMLGPRAIMEKKAQMRAVIDKTLEPLLAQLAAMKDEAEGLYEPLTDPEVAARQASVERLTPAWADLPESTANTILMADEVRENIRVNMTGRVLANINEAIARLSSFHDLKSLPMKELFSRFDATIAAGGDGMLRDVGLILNELSHREMNLDDTSRKGGALGKLARHHLFAKGARLKADLHRIIEECRLTVRGFEQGRPDLLRRLMFEHLVSVKDDGIADDVNPFKTGNLTQQGILLKTDPDRAARLQAEAGRV